MSHIHEKIDPVRSRGRTRTNMGHLLQNFVHFFSANSTFRSVPRPASNGIDFTVEVFIVHKNKVLLRMHDKYQKWMSVGGHIELGEDPVEAAHREVREEVGLDIELVGNQKVFRDFDHSRELIPPIALNRHHTNIEGHEHITLVYFARAKSTAVKAQYEDDKSEECRWCTTEDLDEMDMWPNVKAYALAALARLGTDQLS